MLRIFFLFLISSISLSAQSPYPQDYFGSPLDIPLLLSGNFGELRNNHFHAGLDLKTQGTEGLKIYSAADGYVSCIKIGLFGYGKVLYITHPNGYTTVYAHLQKFAPELEKFVKEQQYAQKKYEIEIYPTQNQFLIKKGEHIAYGGNTGSSAGPHLHFEIRNEASQALNPLLFGYEISDTQSPNIYQLLGYSTDKNSQIDGSQNIRQINLSKQSDGSYLADRIYASGQIGLGIQSIDKKDFTHHIYGVYKVTMKVNGMPWFQYVFDKIDFTQTRYINAFIDYPTYVEKKSRIQRLFKTKGNKITTLYTAQRNNGYLNIEEGFSYIVTIIIEDFKKNETRIELPIEGKQLEFEKNTTEQGKLLIAQRDQYYTFENGNVYFPENTFYENFKIQIKNQGDTVIIHNNQMPVHKYYNLNIKNKRFTDEELPQVFIAYLATDERIIYEKTIQRNNVFSARTRNLGKFMLMKDADPPVLKPVNFGNNQTLRSDYLRVFMKDELSGIKNYTATLNGQWVLFEYEPKEDLLTFNFSDIFPSEDGKYHLILTAKDNVGNLSNLEVFFFKPTKP